MMVMVNHALSALLSPMGLWFLAMAATAALAKAGWRRSAWGLGVLAAVCLWAFSCGWMGRLVNLSLEREFPPVEMSAVPKADAIVILGGGMGSNTNTSPYAEIYAGADRVWHAARLWKAGKAPVVMASGMGEVLSTKPFLMDLGVPANAIRIENAARNTEENARNVERCLDELKVEKLGVARGERKPRVLLVTSAWHMRRAKLMFERYAPGLEVIAAPCDHEATLYADQGLQIGSFFPNAEALMRNSYGIKEIVGYWGYRWWK